MRFPRNAKVFRGQLDAAPLAGVFFLLIIFLLLTMLVYTPGVPIGLSSGSAGEKAIHVLKNGEVIFNDRTYATNTMGQLQTDLKRLPKGSFLMVKEDADAPRERTLQIREWARDFNLEFQSFGTAIQPPSLENATGATGRTAVVAVNVAGHFFFENQLISEQKLEAQLADLAKPGSSPLTLIILADKAVEYGLIVRLTQIAERAGIQNVLLQGKPPASKSL